MFKELLSLNDFQGGIMRVKDWDIDVIPVSPVILISGNLFLN